MVFHYYVHTQENPSIWNIINRTMHLSDAGLIVQNEWFRSLHIRREIDLDAFVVMPNHIHGIVVINDNSVGVHGRATLQNYHNPLFIPPTPFIGIIR